MTANDQGPDPFRLSPDLARYGTDTFTLRSDLRGLDAALRAQLPEAAVFYASRVLEALAGHAVERLGLTASSTLLGSLLKLERFNLLPRATRSWAHALRRMGNEARHVLRAVGRGDATLAALLVERVLGWYFLTYPLGVRARALTDDDAPLHLAEDDDLRAALEAVDRAVTGVADLGATVTATEDVVATEPVLAALLAEVALDRKDFDHAGRILERALEASPRHARLRQLDALRLSRTGALDLARTRLEALARDGVHDPETLGILGGVYKRMWDERDDHASLRRSHDTYLKAWGRFGKSSTYLGINAAATALWLGRPRVARDIAGECRQQLERHRALVRTRTHGAHDLGLWERLTLAESLLILGELAAARAAYRDALGAGADQQARVDVARKQIGLTLRHLGLSLSTDAFLAGPTPRDGRPTFSIGVTGHRSLPDPASVSAACDAALAQSASERPEHRIVVLTSLADGADRLLAERALARGDGAGLRVVLPLEVAQYRSTFLDPADFQPLYDAAESIEVVEVDPTDTGPEAGFERAGRRVVDLCDVLIAVWDGQPSRGRGGTAEIVAYARAQGRAVRRVPV